MRGKTEVVWTCTRKYDGYIGRRMLKMEPPGTRKRGRPKMTLMDAVREVAVTEEDAEGRTEWSWKIRCVDP